MLDDYKKFKYLAEQSYTKNVLDEKKVFAISKTLKRSDLKKYIKMLSKMEDEKNVTIISPTNYYDNKMLSKIFPDKKIIYKNDSTLIAGVKIIDNDMVYEINLKNTLNDIIDHLKKNYD